MKARISPSAFNIIGRDLGLTEEDVEIMGMPFRKDDGSFSFKKERGYFIDEDCTGDELVMLGRSCLVFNVFKYTLREI